MGKGFVSEARMQTPSFTANQSTPSSRLRCCPRPPAIGLFTAWFIVARFAIVPIASKEVDPMPPPNLTPSARPGGDESSARDARFELGSRRA
jgi:hypothetical protein